MKEMKRVKNYKEFNFKPRTIYTNKNVSYGVVAIRLNICDLCKREMIVPIRSSDSLFALFGYLNEFSFQKQIKMAGWLEQSSISINGEDFCIECADKIELVFNCALCKQAKPKEKIQVEFGYPAEIICTDCFDTVPAKIWDEKTKELEVRHRYDWEC